MAANDEVNQLDNHLDRLSIASEESLNRLNTEDVSKEDEESIEKWGFRLKELYRFALRFYKEKEGKAVHISYEDKLKLVAFTCQISHGKYNADVLPPLGVLDVIGRDRRISSRKWTNKKLTDKDIFVMGQIRYNKPPTEIKAINGTKQFGGKLKSFLIEKCLYKPNDLLAWQALGNMSKEGAMLGFIQLLDKLCPLFTPYIEAHKRDLEERERIAREEEERLRIEEENRRREEENRIKQEAQRRQIQEALNQQTYHQFKSYAEQQYPGNPEQQAVLIRQLQEQHYHQYMQQLYQQQCRHQKQELGMEPGDETARLLSNGVPAIDSVDGEAESEEEGLQREFPSISAASMWTRKDIKEFKDSIRKEGGDAIIKVGHGETVTVRVPTHEDGTCLFWEFATDSYDIGFGVYFEWTKSSTSQVSVHISESEDEDDDDDDEDDEDDIERGAGGTKSTDLSNRPQLSIIVPVYRRDCQEEVYAGSHVYPGQGVYLLKFDNSYSLWRSKTLYYRVYYTR